MPRLKENFIFSVVIEGRQLKFLVKSNVAELFDFGAAVPAPRSRVCDDSRSSFGSGFGSGSDLNQEKHIFFPTSIFNF